MSFEALGEIFEALSTKAAVFVLGGLLFLIDCPLGPGSLFKILEWGILGGLSFSPLLPFYFIKQKIRVATVTYVSFENLLQKLQTVYAVSAHVVNG